MITDEQWSALLQTRALAPESVAKAYAARERRAQLTSADGTLFLVAADHPARGSLSIGPDPLAMGDRRALLDSLVTALAHPSVDGVLGSPDIVEELLLLGALEGKVVIGSMNRGGLDGAAWTMDDRFTAYDAESIARFGLDGGKMLLRLDYVDPATARTIEACSKAVNELADRQLMAMVEPLPQRRDEAGRRVLAKDDEALIKAITIGSALGTTSAYTWLKLPASANPEAVYSATTLPCVILGGIPGDCAVADRDSWSRALQMPMVRGLVVGRALLYPSDGDVTAAVAAAASVLRGGPV